MQRHLCALFLTADVCTLSCWFPSDHCEPPLSTSSQLLIKLCESSSSHTDHFDYIFLCAIFFLIWIFSRQEPHALPEQNFNEGEMIYLSQTFHCSYHLSSYLGLSSLVFCLRLGSRNQPVGWKGNWMCPWQYSEHASSCARGEDPGFGKLLK